MDLSTCHDSEHHLTERARLPVRTGLKIWANGIVIPSPSGGTSNPPCEGHQGRRIISVWPGRPGGSSQRQGSSPKRNLEKDSRDLSRIVVEIMHEGDSLRA